MSRNWISISVIVLGLTSWVALSSSCTKNSPEPQSVRFDPLAGTTPVESPAPATADAPVRKKASSKDTTASKGAAVMKRGQLPSEFVVQVGSFASKENADRLAKRLKERNYKAIVVERTHKTLGKLYIVRLEPIKDLEMVKMKVDHLRIQEGLQSTILPK